MEILRECKKAEVYNDGNTLICEAGVSVGPMGGVLLTVPRSLEVGDTDRFRVVFFDPSMGKLTCRCSLSAPLPLPEDKQSFRCEILDRLSQEQRREDLKVPVEAKVMLQVVKIPGDTVRIPAAGWPATTKNISAGGVYLCTDLVLAEGRKVRFDFREAGAPIPLTARILRMDDITEQLNQPRYGYGCQFVELHSRYENQLRNFVFQEERRHRRR